jgi:competence protein ComEA
MPSSIRRPLALVLVLALASLASPPARAADAPAAAPSGKAVAKVDLNSASEAELLALPKIGPATARQILDYRKQVGSIRSVDELLNVKGIGEKTLEVLRPLVTVSGASAKAPETAKKS